MMMRSGRCRRAAASSSLEVMATCPGISSTASQRTAFLWATFSSAGCSMMSKRSFLGDMVKEGLHQGGLPRAGSAADDAVLLLSNELDDRVPDMLRDTARFDQLV